MAKFSGYRSAAIDIQYGKDQFEKQHKRSPMDINSDAGLVNLDCITL